MEPTTVNAAAEKVFSIPELYRIICHEFRGLVSPCAMALEEAKAEYEERPRPGECDWTGNNFGSRHAHAIQMFTDASDSGGTIHDMEHVNYCRAVYSCRVALPAPGRGRFGLLRRPRSGRGQPLWPALSRESVDSRRIAFRGSRCSEHIWWNWEPVIPDGDEHRAAPLGTLALLQARILPDVAEVIRSQAHSAVYSVPCGIGLTVGYAKNKLIDIARDACPSDSQPSAAWDKPRIVRHILAH